MSRVLYLQDLNFVTTQGGAELTDKGYFMEGIRRGHKMDIITPENAPLTPAEKDDIVIISNCRRFDKDALLKIPCRMVVFSHDTYCLYRLYLPNSEKCLTDCPAFDFWDKLYSKAALKIFLSPLHYEVHKMRFKESIEPHILAPSCIDTSLFKKKGRKRAGYCNVSGFMGYKGRAQLIEFAKANPDATIDVVGSTEEPGLGQGAKDVPPNMKALGPMPYHELNEFYNRHEYYVDLPDTVAPFTRSLAEAYLAGCKIVSNELMGCMSYPWFKSRESVRKHLNDAPKEFWNTLERELKL